MAGIAKGPIGEKAPRTDYRKFCVLTICAILFVVGTCEMVVRIGFGRVSRIERRIEGERRAVLELPADPGNRQVLVIGSSLLLHGIDIPNLQRSLGPEFKVVRYVIEQTAYFDWYYGMRRLYAEGIRPAAVVFVMNASYTASNDIRGEYFAYRLMQTRDILSVRRDAHLSATATFSYLFGRWSAFYGTRSETRKLLLAAVAPSVKQLRPLMTPGEPSKQDPVEEVRIASKRLKAFSTLVHENGGQYIFLEAPGLDPEDAVLGVKAAGMAGVPILVPLEPGVLSPSEFMDPYHMNEAGRVRFTAALSPMLRDKLRELLK